MELFSISTTASTPEEKAAFGTVIANKCREIHKKYKSLKMTTELVAPEMASWICTGRDLRASLDKKVHPLYQLAAEACAEYILKQKESGLVKRLLLQEFDFSEQEDIDRIMKICLNLLEKEGTDGLRSWERRFQMLKCGLEEFLQNNRQLNLDGYISFRLGQYGQELKEIVEYAVDEFLMDRQYEEFVGMLKYFVYFQEPQVPLVHVLHKEGHEMVLLDKNMKPLQKEPTEGVVVERLDRRDMEMEDLVVSTLIQASPAKIVIHTKIPSTTAIQTLIQIFDEKVELCSYCHHCSSFFLERGKL